MAIQLSSKKGIEFDIDGTLFTLRKAGLLEIDEILKSTKSDEGDTVVKLIDWFKSLGMPEAIAKELTQEQFEEILSYLNGQKKS